MVKSFIYRFKKRYGCQLCPETDPRCLDFHHRDPKEKTSTINLLAKTRHSLRIIIEEMQKCDLICNNCHRKHDKSFDTVHKMIVMPDKIITDWCDTIKQIISDIK